MNAKKFILRETMLLAAAECLCVAVVIGLFALLGTFDYTVVLGGLLGGALAVGNFFFMAVSADAAADKAANQEVKEGKATMKASYGFRLVAIGVLLFLFAKSGHCNVLALVIPLFLGSPCVMVIEFFRKSGGK